MREDQFTLSMLVRAYECDFQGIVNNAVYMNYLEHARMCFGEFLGISVVQLAEDGVNWVVSQVNLHYLGSLRVGDEFEIATTAKPQGRMRIIFEQQIFKKDSRTPIMEAQVITACVAQGRPVPFPASLTQKVQP